MAQYNESINQSKLDIAPLMSTSAKYYSVWLHYPFEILIAH